MGSSIPEKHTSMQNPHIHHRRSIRLKGYDYSQAGLYFVTICCQNMLCRFGEIVGAGLAPAHDANGKPQGISTTMQLNEFGQIAYDEWVKLSQRFSNFEMDVFQIMPNHIHGIIGIKTGQPHIKTGQPQGLPLPTVGDIVGAYKSLVAIGCLEIYKTKNMKMGKSTNCKNGFAKYAFRNAFSIRKLKTFTPPASIITRKTKELSSSSKSCKINYFGPSADKLLPNWYIAEWRINDNIYMVE